MSDTATGTEPTKTSVKYSFGLSSEASSHVTVCYTAAGYELVSENSSSASVTVSTPTAWRPPPALVPGVYSFDGYFVFDSLFS